MGTLGADTRMGWASKMAVAEEATLGTFKTGTSFLPFLSESMKVVDEKVKIEDIRGGRDTMLVVQGSSRCEGQVSAYLNVAEDACCYLLKGAMGGTVSSARLVTTGGYMHTYNLGDTAHNDSTVGSADAPAISFTIQRGETLSSVYGFAGCKVNKLTLKGEIGKPVTMTMDLVGVSGSVTTIAALTPVFSAIPPLLFSGVSISEAATVSASFTEAHFTGFELMIDNGIVSGAESGRLGSRAPAVLPAGRRTISLKLDQRYDTTTAWNTFVAHTISAIKITCNGVNTITAVAGDTVYSCVINVPHCQWEDSAQPQVGGPGVITHQLSAAGIQKDTSTAYALQMSVANNTAGY